MKPIADLDSMLREAQSRAEPIAAGLLVTANGPSLALLTVYVARAELLRIARLRMPAAEWEFFLEQQRLLERKFDAHCATIVALNADLSKIARSNGDGS